MGILLMKLDIRKQYYGLIVKYWAFGSILMVVMLQRLNPNNFLFQLVFGVKYFLMTSTCLSKTCFLSWKYLHANMTSSFLKSFSWLFSLVIAIRMVTFRSYDYCLMVRVQSLAKYLEQTLVLIWNSAYWKIMLAMAKSSFCGED